MSVPNSIDLYTSKFYTTENAYRTHIQSKKHKDNELKAALQPPKSANPTEASSPQVTNEAEKSIVDTTALSSVVEDNAEDKDEELMIDEKIAAARARLSPTHCLFCSVHSTSLEDSLTHMSSVHSFFIPDAEYLIDLPGLITYLGEKIAVGNVCIFCNEKGKEFRTMEAVRKHMTDKSHCKIAYDSHNDRLEVSDYYDFTSSYPDAATLKKKKAQRVDTDGSDEEWEDADDVDNNDVDEVVEQSASEDDSNEEDSDDLVENEITYGDTNYELVLPSGARIGHRSMRRYYAQSFPSAPRGGKPEDPNSGAALVRRLLADKNAALVPRRGGFGAFGTGTDVIKARNKGEAREAGRHVREFRDQRRREDFKTKVGFIHNSQKHFRDPCRCCLRHF